MRKNGGCLRKEAKNLSASPCRAPRLRRRVHEASAHKTCSLRSGQRQGKMTPQRRRDVLHCTSHRVMLWCVPPVFECRCGRVATPRPRHGTLRLGGEGVVAASKSTKRKRTSSPSGPLCVTVFCPPYSGGALRTKAVERCQSLRAQRGPATSQSQRLGQRRSAHEMRLDALEAALGTATDAARFDLLHKRQEFPHLEKVRVLIDELSKYITTLHENVPDPHHRARTRAAHPLSQRSVYHVLSWVRRRPP